MSEAASRLAGELAAAIDASGSARPTIALVLGSGLGALADGLEDATAVSFEDLPSMPKSTVPGHAGRFVVGDLNGARVLCQQGRVHLYEGHSAEVVTRAVRAFAAIGVRTLILTNAAGGIVADWPVPTLMRVEDHINRQGLTPLSDDERAIGCPYAPEVAAAIDAAAADEGVRLERGVYMGLLGPSYETPAEVRMCAKLGAHAIGMSTVLEASAGHAAGMAVGAVSCITNPAAGISKAPLDHAEVVDAGAQIASDFQRLLGRAAARLAASHAAEDTPV